MIFWAAQDREFHVSFRLPLKWSVEYQFRSTDGDEPVAATPESIAKALQGEVEKKIEKRTRDGVIDYQIPAEKCERRKVGKRDALSCVAGFKKQSGEAMRSIWCGCIADSLGRE